MMKGSPEGSKKSGFGSLVTGIGGQERIDQEFYVVCLLNALFGDPRVPLVRLHPRWGKTAAVRLGPGNVVPRSGEEDVQAMLNYLKDKPLSEKVLSVDVLKIRKNALSEVMRFLCQVEYCAYPDRIDSDDKLYASVYMMLLNGDIVSATRTLNKHGKSNLALCLSQCLQSSSRHK